MPKLLEESGIVDTVSYMIEDNDKDIVSILFSFLFLLFPLVVVGFDSQKQLLSQLMNRGAQSEPKFWQVHGHSLGTLVPIYSGYIFCLDLCINAFNIIIAQLFRTKKDILILLH